MEIPAFPAQTIEIANWRERDALPGDFEGKVRKGGVSRAEDGRGPVFQDVKLVPGPAPPAALVCVVASLKQSQTPIPRSRAGSMTWAGVVSPGGEHQESLGLQVHGLGQQEVHSASRGAYPGSRVTRTVLPLAQHFGQPFDMAALACAVDTFERDELALHLPPL